ncbi:nudix hydrolase 26, chloroplastic isoform X2 [Ricinus communis]|uniref:nudix hydrolase 26, chloroplastic isoform X2 n=1 Tax=Ricinus communis TaxID=3988 RepID=UPI00201AEB3A|nr:nudix hydrolase 26, chloroplastic isoform X2 [Ricinus communis]
MAFCCRCVFYYSSSSFSPSLPILSKSATPYLTCPYKFSKFTKLPLTYHNPQNHTATISRTLRLSSSSSSPPPPPPPMESPPEGYRRNVGICLINPSKKIFAASRLDISDAWQMPQLYSSFVPNVDDVSNNDINQGGIDENEDPKTAAVRELKEETGISSAEVLAEAPNWLTYDFPPQVREKLKQQWGSDWKGQAQKWFLLKFTGKEEEINLLGDGLEKPEFGQWSWMSPEQILDHLLLKCIHGEKAASESHCSRH